MASERDLRLVICAAIELDFPNYASGAWGPEATQGLLAQQGHRWPLPAELRQPGQNVRGAASSKKIK